MNRRLNRFIKTLIFSLFHSLSLLKALLSENLIQSLSLHSMLFDYDNEYDDGFSTPLATPFTLPNDEPQLYLVNDRWWNEARGAVLSSDITGVSYLTTSMFSKVDDFWEVNEHSSEISMKMMREETEGGGEGVLCEYALLLDWMFLRALKWHNDLNKGETILSAQDTMQDPFSLKIRYFLGKMNILDAKISRKENEAGTFERACNIFCVDDDGQFRIRDFSGQITQFSVNDRNIPDSALQNEGILLELQLYGLSHMTKGRHRVKDETVVDQFKGEDFFWTGSPKMNGSINISADIRVDCQPSNSLYREARAMGLTGLLNLGNTCFMNSAVQCLVHTPKFVDYFLGDFKKDLNFENPLGMNGKLALASGDLFRKLWTPGARPVAPSIFKSALSAFAPQFSGYNQQDAQEFLAFLLDGLHEDLNRVKCKPYIEVKDADNIPDNEVADEHWRNHLARNDSIIVDVCQGQFRSKLVCPICKKVSITFDPFMYVSLPLPSTTMRTMTLTVLSTDGSCMPIPVTVTVPKFGKCEDLVKAVSVACSLRDDETLLLAEVYGSQIMHFLDKPSDSIDLLRDSDQLVAYRLPKDSGDSSYLVVFMHQYEHTPMYKYVDNWKKFGIPLLARMSDISKGSDIREQFLKLLSPFLMSVEDVFVEYDDAQTSGSEDSRTKDGGSSVTINVYVNSEVEDGDVNSVVEDDLNVRDDFHFSLVEEHSLLAGTPIEMNEPLPSPRSCRKYTVLVTWPNKMMNLYDTARLISLPEICKSSLFTKRPQESVSLYKCLDGFLKEEPLGPEDMWYCPKCKEHRQASKKLDLWRLPEILVIHLKRFSYNRFSKSKLGTFVDFPVEDLDLTHYIVHRTSEVSERYSLYAIVNHYGSLSGGHYTAFVQHGQNQWYEFDDSHVSPVAEEQIKTSAAYVLFYRRI
ncbi:hypothetical protein DCAR_0417589 [Daucus carota subsp. sativus]|uniref:Ubiquitin carboxyl-terminal hydrolase n=1 Tax=Daucus carota subsp. sativus TaxID=79200 RepID=A0AAF1AWR2_DAUCS|nr:PREDICTED: ubiquitin carboxyl-terminal hydrolase 8-like [Daucus carota subsp. sativus]WOG98248.1 hypothetical protein DCAR_0417589 [Daucus carota subsp. sativus]